MLQTVPSSNLFGICILIAFKRLLGKSKQKCHKSENLSTKDNSVNEYSFIVPKFGMIPYWIYEEFFFLVLYLVSEISSPDCSNCERLPSHIVASSWIGCLGTRVAPSESYRVALSGFVTAGTNGSDVSVCFSVNHSLPAWCVSPGNRHNSIAPSVKRVW